MRDRTTPVARAACGDATFVRVLGNRVVWDAITSYMTGYPRVVSEFLRASSLVASDGDGNGDTDDGGDSTLSHATKTLTPQSAHLVGDLSRRGILVHRAIAASDAHMLETLHRLSTHAQYRRDAKLSFRRAMRCAVAYNNLAMMQRVAVLTGVGSAATSSASASATEALAVAGSTITVSIPESVHLPVIDQRSDWGHHLLRIALLRDDPDARVLDWLATHLPRAHRRLSCQCMVFHAQRGHVATLQWLRAHGGRVSRAMVDAAARSDQLRMLQYLYAHSRKRCSRDAVSDAAALGHLAIIKFVVAHETKATSNFASMMAATHGHLDIVRFMIEHVEPSAATRDPLAINSAAASGHLDIVKYLHAHLDDSDSVAFGLKEAAAHGHLDVVEFLHEHHPRDCCPEAIGGAARRGHLAVVQYLHAHSHETCAHVCTPLAFDKAAAQGYLEVVRFLHEHRSEGCTASALDSAAKSGHADVVAFLCEHRSEGDVVSALCIAALHGHFELVQTLHDHLERGQSTLAAVSAALRRQHHGIARFLCEHQDNASERILRQAVAGDEMQVVRAAARYVNTRELVETAAFAAVQSRARACEFLGFAIETRRRQSRQ